LGRGIGGVGEISEVAINEAAVGEVWGEIGLDEKRNIRLDGGNETV